MRTQLKAAIAGAYAAAGGLRRLHASRLVVLTFHRVRPDGEKAAARPMRNLEVAGADFRRLLMWMRSRYEPLALGDWLMNPAPLSRPAFAVTFDDGWADNYEQAFPVLRELGVPATIFLATGAVEERTPFWWQDAELSDAEIEQMKNLPPAQTEALAADKPGRREMHADDYLTWEQVREMGQSRLVTFGPHGHRHVRLTQVSRAEAVEDIRRCLELMERNAGGALVPVFAWPNGDARTDFGKELADMGLRAAFGMQRGAISALVDRRWDLPRNNVDRALAGVPGLLPWLLMCAR